jgi:hypothetical protein
MFAHIFVVSIVYVFECQIGDLWERIALGFRPTQTPAILESFRGRCHDMHTLMPNREPVKVIPAGIPKNCAVVQRFQHEIPNGVLQNSPIIAPGLGRTARGTTTGLPVSNVRISITAGNSGVHVLRLR